MPGTSPGMGCSTARAQIHLTAKCRGCCASNRTQHALVERSIVRINRKQWSAPTSGCLVMGEGVRGDRDFFISGLAPRFPAHVHECVVGPCPSRGNQAIALGSDVGGRVAGVHPRQMRVLSESAWLRSCLYFPVFLQKKSRTRPQARSRNEKPGAACRPGSWRSFGEYALLEDSRYTSQAENWTAVSL
jgi:hypothetical protein